MFFALNVCAADFEIKKLEIPANGKTGFTLMGTASTGIQFTNILPEIRRMTNANLMNGSGVALGDVDGDGLCDVYFCSLDGASQLYKNLGNWKFKDITGEAGVSCAGQSSTGAVFADLDGDGDLDLLVTSMGGPNACFINDGKGHFTDKTSEAGLLSKWGSSSMALADLDGNGTLDLYVCNYGVSSILRSGGSLSYRTNAKGEPVVQGRNSKRLKIIAGVLYELGEPDILYLNDGHAHFTPVKWSETFVDEQGRPVAETPWDQGLSVILRDLNEDGSPDIYVCNDASMPERIWLNDGHGKFHAASNLEIRKTSHFSMGVDVADFDHDGHEDIFTVDMLSREHVRRMVQHSTMPPQANLVGDIAARFQQRRNVLLAGRGDGTFEELANLAGVSASEWTWACIFMDVDLDGWEDLLVTNGFPHDADDADMRAQISQMGKLSIEQSRRTTLMFPKLETPNCAFKNLRDRTFQETGHDWGFAATAVSNGMALADLDNDGDMDLVVNCMNSGALIYRNETAAPRVLVRLKGGEQNRFGIGARITVAGGPVTQTQVVMAGGRYVSSDEPARVFAAGKDSGKLSVTVDWADGRRSEVGDVPANSTCTISAAGAKPGPKSAARSKPLFTADPGALSYEHQKQPFDEFALQPSLPRKISNAGPVIAAVDLNGDHRDDLIIGGAKGSKTTVFLNENGKLQAAVVPPFEKQCGGDVTALAAYHSASNRMTVIQAQTNYEDPGTPSKIEVLEVVGGQWTVAQTIEVPVAVGSLALGDIDGDGDLDLFIGGRCVPGQYPRAAASFIYRNNKNVFTVDAENSGRLREIGLATGGVFADLNGDGSPELIVACEWGPIRVFANAHGALSDASTTWKTEGSRGLWTFVTTADVNGDGLPDIVAGNWGRNTLYASRLASEVALVHGDFNGDGRETMIEAYRTAPAQKFVPFLQLDVNAKAMPWLTAAFPTHTAFGKASVEEVLGERRSKAQTLAANCFDSSVFINRSGTFERQALPVAAQSTQANAAVVGDFNADGRDDLYLAQNFFAVRDEDERLDAGRGLMLFGGKDGTFIADSLTNGVAVYGQQGACALIDLNGSGTEQLITTQNSAAAQLFRAESRPTLRVLLAGNAPNFDAVGAVIRLKQNGAFGGGRMIQCASGPVGQSSFTQTFARAGVSVIEVRWPGGKTVEYSLAEGMDSVLIDESAGLTQLRAK